MSSVDTFYNSTNVPIKSLSSKENENLSSSVASGNKHVHENRPPHQTTEPPLSTSKSSNDIYLTSNESDLAALLDNLKHQPSSLIKIADKNDIGLVKVFAYIVCREYLSGAWKNIEFEHFNIERISGGLTNYLYACSIDKASFRQVDQEPSKILIRLYGENNNKNPTVMLKDVVVSAMMSDNNLGPKLYGIFPSGRLEQFINASSMNLRDQFDPQLSRQIAKVTAKFHTLDMPFIKEPHWLFETTAKYLRKVKDVQFTREIDVELYKKLQTFDFDKEFIELKKVLISVNSPVVFCHNDINVGNILKLPHKLMVIDYEYGSYNYRGFDLGNHFCEWMMNNNYENHPYFEYNYDIFPNREQQLNFVRAYIKQFRKTIQERFSQKAVTTGSANENNDINDDETISEEDLSNMAKAYLETKNLDEEHLIKEANHFALASNFFWIQWSILQASACKIKFEYLEYALARCDAYYRHKSLLFPYGFEDQN